MVEIDVVVHSLRIETPQILLAGLPRFIREGKPVTGLNPDFGVEIAVDQIKRRETLLAVDQLVGSFSGAPFHHNGLQAVVVGRRAAAVRVNVAQQSFNFVLPPAVTSLIGRNEKFACDPVFSSHLLKPRASYGGLNNFV